MKRILIILMLMFTTNIIGVEILEEFYIMEKIIPYLKKAENYELNGIKVKAIKVDKKILKTLKTEDTPFYSYDSNRKKNRVRLGDYIISPLTLSEIYFEDKENFLDKYIKK